VRFHALRHTAFTRMAVAEVNPETIRQLAGYSDVRVTLAVYTRPTATMKCQAVRLVGRLYAEAEVADQEEGVG
jgi:integrase